jgi:hypothetical protein
MIPRTIFNNKRFNKIIVESCKNYGKHYVNLSYLFTNYSFLENAVKLKRLQILNKQMNNIKINYK